jgi:quercetin dioxygenase-like cupin family protein
MIIVKKSLFLALMVFLGVSAAAASEKGGQATTTGPTVVSEAMFPITLGNSEYDLLTRVIDFPAGTGNPNHKHGGHVLVTVLSGEMTLREKGTEKIVKAGDSWTENPGNVHAVVNAGSVTARVVASFLIPKGAEITTPVK